MLHVQGKKKLRFCSIPLFERFFCKKTTRVPDIKRVCYLHQRGMLLVPFVCVCSVLCMHVYIMTRLHVNFIQISIFWEQSVDETIANNKRLDSQEDGVLWPLHLLAGDCKALGGMNGVERLKFTDFYQK